MPIKEHFIQKQKRKLEESIASRIGNKFGRLTVVNITNEKDKRGRLLWEFKCDCGNTLIRDYYRVKTRHLKSCGCIDKERIANANFVILYNRYKISAKTRNLEFNLTHEQFRFLTKQNCHYCNIEPKQTQIHRPIKSPPYVYNGVDRKNNNIGYHYENCVPCCVICNGAKSHYFTYKEFKTILDDRRLNSPNIDIWEDLRPFYIGRFNKHKKKLDK